VVEDQKAAANGGVLTADADRATAAGANGGVARL